MVSEQKQETIGRKTSNHWDSSRWFSALLSKISVLYIASLAYTTHTISGSYKLLTVHTLTAGLHLSYEYWRRPQESNIVKMREHIILVTMKQLAKGSMPRLGPMKGSHGMNDPYLGIHDMT